MAARNGGETNGCTFQWKVENISHCWLKTGETIPSPTFIADTLEGTKWSLQLFPMGETNDNVISFYLHREKDSSGPSNFEVNYQLSFLGKGGSFLKKIIILNRSFTKDKSWGFVIFEDRERVFVTEKEAFLPEDTLTVECMIWNREEKPVKPKHFYARTVFKENRKSFVWRINEFSALKRGLRNKFKDGLIDFDLILNQEQDFEKKMVLCMNSFDESIKLFSIKTSIADSEGRKESCGIHEYFPSDLKKGVLLRRLFTEMFMENSSLYLPIDVLYLDCEYVSLNISLLYEYFGSGVTSKLKNEDLERKEHSFVKEDSRNTTELVKDLKSMYNDVICSDMELRTSTRTFQTHKNILSARSPVFRRMFSHDMKEKNSGYVDIEDLENDTLHQMLTYIYSDSIEDLQFENASKLYSAADKYEILSLKSRCSSFLRDNLSPIKACQVLILAHQHQDDDLKCFVQDYIIEHDKEVFGSREWEDFMDTNLKLAADVMYRKVYP